MSVQSWVRCSSWLWTIPCPLTRYELRCDDMCDILSFQGHQLMTFQYSIYSEIPVAVQWPCSVSSRVGVYFRGFPAAGA